MTDRPRLIEVAFPLKQASLDSVHEKNVRHGHISTLHIWPARRPLAAARAALIATLLPDPGTPEARRELVERIGGKVVPRSKGKVSAGDKASEENKETTEGGVLHWGRENSPDMDWFRDEIRKAYDGRAPRVLDPFAGGGAIPLEAMRLGCEVTANDLNPVAWFILKCTLEYPQKLAGQKLPLPDFVLSDEAFMTEFFKANPDPDRNKRLSKKKQIDLFDPPESLAVHDEEGSSKRSEAPMADLAWHVRAWGLWVLREARRDLARFYPTYADFQPLKPTAGGYEHREARLVPLKEDGSLNLEALNAEFAEDYLSSPATPRWVAKATVAYLWARTVQCKNCRARVPLLKTLWLAKKDKKRVKLSIQPNADRTGVEYGIETGVPQVGGNATQRREHDKRIGAGTMSRSGGQCPCCGTIMTMEDIRLEGQAGRLGAEMTAVVVDGLHGKEYRRPTVEEVRLADEAKEHLAEVFDQIPFGLPTEPTPKGGNGASRAFSVDGYGLDQWHKLFTPRQLLAIGTFLSHSRGAGKSRQHGGYPVEWVESLAGYLALIIDRLVDRGSSICHWDVGYEKVANTFTGYRLPISWDYAETNVLGGSSGSYNGQVEWVARVIEHCQRATSYSQGCRVTASSATRLDYAEEGSWDLVLTDPPYYDAIPYSDLMDFFYVWLRRNLRSLSREVDDTFRGELAPKWDGTENDGELIDDPSRFGNDSATSKAVYEEGMLRAFQASFRLLKPNGRLVVVFAHKQPDAWETLVAAIIRAGFVVEASWPIQTEMGNRTRAQGSAALSSSVWLVCRKRPENARPGWDNKTIEEMKANSHGRLHDYWDAGVRGPDFVWAATGPALEAYSRYPVVKKANEPGSVMGVAEFLRAVRRIVVDFVVGRVLSHGGAENTGGLDDVTTYYLLHRHDFGMEPAPAGACILYAVSCGLSDKELADRYDILSRAGGRDATAGEDEDDGGPADTEQDTDQRTGGSGSEFKLKAWQQRSIKGLGVDAPDRPGPLIDQIHRLMHLWKGGDVVKVDEYLDVRGLRRNPLFHQVLQALIELAGHGSEERSLLESISNHVAARGAGSGQIQFETESSN